MFSLHLLPIAAQSELRVWISRMERLAQHGRGYTRFAAEIAEEWGTTYATIVRLYDRWRRFGAAGLVDRRKHARYLDESVGRGLPPAFIEHLKSRFERFQRNHAAIKMTHRLVLDELKQWRRGNGPAIPGYDTPPKNQGGTGYPAGWSYANISRVLSDQVEKTLARQGRAAGKKYLPMVYTTRVGLVPGQVIIIDDQWDDVQVAWAHGKVARPLSFDLIDVCSCYEILDGVQPRVERDDGTKVALSEEDAFWLLLTHFSLNGYRDDTGTHVIVERGTATVRAEFAQGFADATDGRIIIDKGGVDNRGLKGLIFGGPAKGNPRFKALREGTFAFHRTLAGYLPGATGRNRDEAPEEQEALVRYATKALAAVPEERRHLLRLPMLTEEQYRGLRACIKAAMNERTEHVIEGWETLGFLATEFRHSEGSEHWLPFDDAQRLMLSLPPERQEMLSLAFELHKDQLIRTRRLSPAEVWEAHKGKLVKLPVWKWNMVIPARHAHARTINDSRSVVLTGISPDPLRYDARVRTARGHEILLRPGDDVLIYVNPFMPQQILCCDVHGACLGVMHQIIPSTKIDHEGFQRRMGEVRQISADIEHPVARRAADLAGERSAMIKHNQAVIEGQPITTEEKAEAKASRQQASRHQAIADTVIARVEISSAEAADDDTPEWL